MLKEEQTLGKLRPWNTIEEQVYGSLVMPDVSCNYREPTNSSLALFLGFILFLTSLLTFPFSLVNISQLRIVSLFPFLMHFSLTSSLFKSQFLESGILIIIGCDIRLSFV